MPEPEQGPEPGPGQAPPVDWSVTGRDRLLASLRRPARTQVVVAVLLAVVGFAGVTQIRANTVDNSYSGLREQDLIDVLTGLAGTTQRTQTEIDRLTRTRQSLLSATDARQAALAEAQQQADNLSVLAGLVPVTGPGVRITITEKTGLVAVTSMLDTIEQLRTDGAEAIQLNGQVRVVASTSFDEGVGGLTVDGQLVESPFVLDAIGTPNLLAAAIEFGLGPRSELEGDGATVDVQQLTSLDVTAVVDGASTATPQPGG